MIRYFLFIFALMVPSLAMSQTEEKMFTHSDTLRGSVNSERERWNVLRYDITVEPDFGNKSLKGKNVITYKTIQEDHDQYMQIDLQEPLVSDSIILNREEKFSFTREGLAWHVKASPHSLDSQNQLEVFYHGKPREAVQPPWDGGWTFTKDSLGRPWMTVTCQGLGASVWYPNKDHQSDEPDNGGFQTRSDYNTDPGTTTLPE